MRRTFISSRCAAYWILRTVLNPTEIPDELYSSDVWVAEANATREERVKEFFFMDEADPKQHLFNDTMAHKGKLETVRGIVPNAG